ncbi:MAG: CRISPR-associated protein Cas4 [Methylacidiphilales bacterium]|nr:CRISPR-associated protein Cas4 [Candidatus Methylacidiphilales bacterium]
MPLSQPKTTDSSTASELIPLSALNHFTYCPRRAALILTEGLFEDNEFTLLGELAHQHTDLPGFEHRAGWKLLRALPLWSDRLSLVGKADLVEIQEHHGRITAARPIEYKSGKKSRWFNDRVQLCAQALCLEEMLGIPIPEGMIYHAKSHQRSLVSLDPTLRSDTLQAIDALKKMLDERRIPPAKIRPQCDGCSLRNICLPEAFHHPPQKLYTASPSTLPIHPY